VRGAIRLDSSVVGRTRKILQGMTAQMKGSKSTTTLRRFGLHTHYSKPQPSASTSALQPIGSRDQCSDCEPGIPLCFGSSNLQRGHMYGSPLPHLRHLQASNTFFFPFRLTTRERGRNESLNFDISISLQAICMFALCE
jgi:hypothetical protein